MKSVEYKDIPATIEGFPGAVAIQITADSREDVQEEINRFFAKACQVDGLCEFRNPFRTFDGRWQSRGYATNQEAIGD
jgi:hypothetical protein